MSKKKGNLLKQVSNAIDIAEKVITSEPIRRAVCGVYTDGTPRAFGDALNGITKNPYEKKKKKKKKGKGKKKKKKAEPTSISPFSF